MNAPLLVGPARARLDCLAFDNRFARLDPAFYTRLDADPLPAPYLVAASGPAAGLIGLDPAEFDRPEFAETFAGNRPLAGAEPLAAVYSGHQFGVWAGQLGDGRALLLGEALGPGGARWEIQLKGAGRTPYSRMGDGRAVLRSSIREFLCSEAMAALGVPTTRALSVVGSDQAVLRESVETAAVVARMSPSFVRFGSFEHFYYAGDHARLRRLADFVIDHHFPALRETPEPHAALLEEVTRRTARLIAHWQSLGFCHGVMNTDNMSILGLTIDYGPFAFMDGFDPGFVCNHSDTEGRYAYAMQPGIGEWNCYCLGQALMPLVGSVERAQAALAVYRPEFEASFEARLRDKLGLAAPDAQDASLFERTFELMRKERIDFTRFFRSLSRLRSGDASGDAACRDLFIDRSAFDAWASEYRARLRREGRDDASRAHAMDRVNPKYVLRTWLAEVAIREARGGDEAHRLRAPGAPVREDRERDFDETRRLAGVLERPFDEQPRWERYAQSPPDWAAGIELSCSS
ncbi:MAG: YdiU family protein [Burkholderiaceae bacterium]